MAGQLITMTIGRHLVSKAINDSSSSIYTSMKSIYYYSKDIDGVIKELDIKNKLKTIECTCAVLNANKEIPKGIETCLEALHDIILNIKCDLKIINAKLAKHHKKYFNGWRSLNIKKYINNLKSHCNILDKRYSLLANTMVILK